jgi:hypothetical protein
MIVSQLAPFLLDLACKLFPVSFHAIPIHILLLSKIATGNLPGHGNTGASAMPPQKSWKNKKMSRSEGPAIL